MEENGGVNIKGTIPHELKLLRLAFHVYPSPHQWPGETWQPYFQFSRPLYSLWDQIVFFCKL